MPELIDFNIELSSPPSYTREVLKLMIQSLEPDPEMNRVAKDLLHVSQSAKDMPTRSVDDVKDISYAYIWFSGTFEETLNEAMEFLSEAYSAAKREFESNEEGSYFSYGVSVRKYPFWEIITIEPYTTAGDQGQYRNGDESCGISLYEGKYYLHGSNVMDLEKFGYFSKEL